MRTLTRWKFASLAVLSGMMAAPGVVAAHVAGVAAEPPAAVAAADQDAALTAFLDGEFAIRLTFEPELATTLGSKVGVDRLNDISDAGRHAELEWRRASVARMKATFDRARLSPASQVDYDLWINELDRAELSYQYRRYLPPFFVYISSLDTDLPNFLINRHVVHDIDDLRAYIARIRAIPGVLDTGIALSRVSDAAGILAPRFQIQHVIEDSRAIITGAPFGNRADSPLWADAKAKIAQMVAKGAIDASQADQLRDAARLAILDLRPAYERVIAWAEADLPEAPAGKTGAITLPDGKAWYAAALKLNTTTDLTAAQIHRIGLDEVARITGEEDAIARQAGLADHTAYAADRARRFPPQLWTDALRQTYLAAANAALAHNRTLLSGYFGNLPVYPTEVVREPAFSEVAGGAAHASAATADGSRPGRVYVHMLGQTPDPADLYDLMCHEGIPGHLLQGDIRVRQARGPLFRKATGYVAFNEGWGLYAEELCHEMGAYPDPAAEYYRLEGELFRAARLVVDTGIHADGWSEEQAIAYLITAGHLPPDQARSEARRYITLPGQATGYMIGMLKIVELRHKAERALGSRFDIRGFHDTVIGAGAQPLPVLERRIDDWIAARQKAS